MSDSSAREAVLVHGKEHQQWKLAGFCIAGVVVLNPTAGIEPPWQRSGATATGTIPPVELARETGANRISCTA